MATVQDRITNRKKAMLRWADQVNNEVCLLRYNKALLIFQKEVLEYIANKYQTQSVTLNIVAWQNEYNLPTGISGNADFYSVAQLRVASDVKNWYPVYRVCDPINIGDYNIDPKEGKSIWEPMIVRRISARNPRYTFINKTQIKIFPTPKKNVTAGLHLTFNYIQRVVELSTNEASLCLPRYFLDVVDDYLSYRLIEAENPELAGMYYQTFITTLHNNIYWLNRDQRVVEEEFADLRYFYHN